MISGWFQPRSVWLICENGLLRKKPFLAERGEGCAEARMTCLAESMSLVFT